MPKFAGVDVDISRLRIFGAELQVVELPGDLSALHLRLHVPDRNTGKPNYVANQYTVDAFELREMRSASFLKERIRDFIIDAVIHEVEEALLIDGKRVFDPHENDPGYVAEPVEPLPNVDVRKLGSRYW